MTDMEVPGSGRFVSMGVPAEILDLTVLVPPNDLDALEKALGEHASDGGVAAIFCEPIGGESASCRLPTAFMPLPWRSRTGTAPSTCSTRS